MKARYDAASRHISIEAIFLFAHHFAEIIYQHALISKRHFHFRRNI